MMKKQILTLIIGILIGAIITTGVFLILKGNTDIPENPMQRGEMPTMDGSFPNMENGFSIPEEFLNQNREEISNNIEEEV